MVNNQCIHFLSNFKLLYHAVIRTKTPNTNKVAILAALHQSSYAGLAEVLDLQCNSIPNLHHKWPTTCKHDSVVDMDTIRSSCDWWL